MSEIRRRTMLAALAGVAAAMAGCSLLPERGQDGGSAEAWAAVSNGAPVRTAVYVGRGARGVGMFRWMQLVDQAPELKAVYVDGEAVRKGALRHVDMLVMPGGKSNVEAAELGEKGQLELRRFIEGGGSYVGTCAGAFLLMRGGGKDDGKILGIAPYRHRRGSWGGEAMLQVEYLKDAERLCGIKAGKRTERFNGGPVMDPSEPVKGADFKVMARFNCNLHTDSAKPGLPSMGGGASAVAGTFGRGRVWLFAGHPEYYPSTWPSVKAAFKFATGRDVTLRAPQRRRGQLAVGWWCKPAPGVRAAELARSLVRDDDFDVVPYSNDEIDRTGLMHIDALVLPDAADTNLVDKLASTNGVIDRITAYMDRGGKVFTWGRTAQKLRPHRNLVNAGSPWGVASAMRDLKKSPAPAPRRGPAPKVKNPVRAAAYFDLGASGAASAQWVKLLSLSPDCEFSAVSAEDVRNGALAGKDLYIAPGGMSSTQAKTLGPRGCSNLVEFVRGGGGYFGTCAGCYLAMSLGESAKTSGRLGMMPYKAQISPYRGGAELSIRFTDNADMFGLRPGSERTVRYHGGPVPVPCEAVPGADVREIARYACDGVYSSSTNTSPVMAGHPAVLAGTFGKGRLVGTSPHPESYFHTQDIIRGGLRYITGRGFEAEYPQRTRGNLSVCFHGRGMRKDGATLLAKLFREPSIDLRTVADETIGYGELEHCDALVMCHPNKDKMSRRICAFARNGGRLFVLGSDAELATVPKDLPNVTGRADADALRAELLKFAEEK